MLISLTVQGVSFYCTLNLLDLTRSLVSNIDVKSIKAMVLGSFHNYISIITCAFANALIQNCVALSRRDAN
jgi:hypothetical protein